MGEGARIATPAASARTSLPAPSTPAWRVTTSGDAVERDADARTARAIGARPASSQSGPSRPAPAPRVTPDVAHAASLRGGEALPPGLARHFGTRFGQDFSDVRLHRGPAAAAATRALDTPAFAVGRNIHLAPAQWRPDAPGGQRLLAHELAHVAQNLPGTIARFVGDPTSLDSPREGEALPGPARDDPRAAADARRRASRTARRRETARAAQTGAPPPAPEVVPAPPDRPRRRTVAAPPAPSPSPAPRRPDLRGSPPAPRAPGPAAPAPTTGAAAEAAAGEAIAALGSAPNAPVPGTTPTPSPAAPAATGGLPPLAGMVAAPVEMEEGAEADSGEPADTDALLGELVLASEATGSRVAAAAQAARTALSRQAGRSEAALGAAKTREVGAIRAAYGLQRVRVAGMILAGHAQINTIRTAHRANAATRGVTGALEMTAVFTTHRQSILDKITAAGTRATTMRTTARTRLSTRTQAQEGEARRLAVDAWGSYGTSERAAHMASAANGTAHAIADEMVGQRTEALAALDEATAELPAAIEDTQTQALAGLLDGLPPLLTQINDNTTATLADLDTQAAQAHRALAASGIAIDAELATAEQEAVTAAETALPEQLAPLRTAAAAGRRGITDAEAATTEALSQRQAEAEAMLSETEKPEAESAAEFVAGVAELLAGMGDDAAAEFESLVGEITGQMTRGAAAGAAGYTRMAQAATAAASQRAGEAAGQIETFLQEVDTRLTGLLTTQDTTIRDGCTQTANDLRPNATAVQAHLNTMLGDAQRDLDSRITEAVGHNDDALRQLPGQMIDAAVDAAWDYDHPVLSTLRDVGLVVAGVIAGLLLVVVLVVAVIVACKLAIIGLVALGVSAVVAEIIVACAAIAVAGYFAYQAYAAHRDAGEGVASSLGNAALDMIGVNQMRAAFNGKGTLFERGFAFGQGLGTLITTVVPVARAARVRVNARFGTRIPALRAPRPLRIARVHMARSSVGRPISRALANPVATGQRANAALAPRVRALLGRGTAGEAATAARPPTLPPPSPRGPPPTPEPPPAAPARPPPRPAAAAEPRVIEAPTRRTAEPARIGEARAAEGPARATPETATPEPPTPEPPAGPARAAEPPRLRSIRGGGEGNGRPAGRLAEAGREPRAPAPDRPPTAAAPEALPSEAAAEAVPEPMRLAAGAEGGVVEGGTPRWRPEVIEGGAAEGPRAMASEAGGGSGGGGGRPRAPSGPSSRTGPGGARRGGRSRATPDRARAAEATSEGAAAEAAPESTPAAPDSPPGSSPAVGSVPAEAGAPPRPAARPRGRARPGRPPRSDTGSSAADGSPPAGRRASARPPSGEPPARGRPRPDRPATPPPERPPGPPPATDPLSVRIEGMESAQLGNMMEAVFTAAETRFYGMRYRSNPALRAQIEALASEARATGRVNASGLAPVDRVTLYRLVAHEGTAAHPHTTVTTTRPAGLGTPGSPSRTVEVATRFADDPHNPYQVRPGEVRHGEGGGATYPAMQRNYNRPARGGAPSGPSTYLRRSSPRGPDRALQGAEAAEVRTLEAARAGGGAVDQALEGSLVELGAENLNTWQAMRRPPGANPPPPAGAAVPEALGTSLPERIGGVGDMNSMAGQGSSRVAQFDARRPGVTDVGGNTRAATAANRARRFHGRAEGVRTLNRVAAEDLASGSPAGARLAPVRSSFREFVRSFLDVTQPEAGTTTTAGEAAEAFASSREELINALVEMMQRSNR